MKYRFRGMRLEVLGAGHSLEMTVMGLYYDDMSDRCPNCGSKDINYKGYLMFECKTTADKYLEILKSYKTILNLSKELSC